MAEEHWVFEFGRITSQEQFLGIALAFLGILVGMWVIARKDLAKLPFWVRNLVLLLRTMTLASLLLIFLNPLLRKETTTILRSRVVLAFDQSRSMTVKDATSATKLVSRAERLKGVLGDSGFIESLRQTHDVIIAGVGERTQILAELPYLSKSSVPKDSLVFDPSVLDKCNQDESRLGESLLELLRKEAASPLSGIVVLTDGRTTDGISIDVGGERPLGSSRIIVPVLLGGDVPLANLSIRSLAVPERVYKGDNVEIKLELEGFADVPRDGELTLELESSTQGTPAKSLAKRKVSLGGDKKKENIVIPYVPDQPGRYRLRAHLAGPADEVRDDDNVAFAPLEVIEQKTNVLILAGGPSREYRFLRNLLFRDASVELAVLLQSSNGPISQDAKKVLTNFPETRNELFGYDVIVAIDPSWSELTGVQRDLLVEWVSVQAGGLILVAGPVNSPKLSRDATLDEIQRLYPIVFKEIYSSDIEQNAPTQPWALEWTKDGLRSDFLSLGTNEADAKERWGKFTGFYWCMPASGVRPAATVFARFPDPRLAIGGEKIPALAEQFFGSGRVFFIGSPELWRVRSVSEKIYDQLWIKLIRQMGQSRLLKGSSRGELRLNSDVYSLGEAVRVTARVVDSNYKPLSAESLPLAVTGPKGKEMITLMPVTEPGRFQTTYQPTQPGEYRFTLTPPGTDQQIERPIVVRVAEKEFLDPRVDMQALKKLASDRPGIVFKPDELSKIVPLLEDQTQLVTTSGAEVRLWDRFPWLVLIAAFLGAEWSLRKFYHLA